MFFVPANALAAEVEHGLDQWKDLAKTYGVDLILTAHRHIQEAAWTKNDKSPGQLVSGRSERLGRSGALNMFDGRCMRTMMSPTWWHRLHGSSVVVVVALPLKQSPRRLAKTTSRLRCTKAIAFGL